MTDILIIDDDTGICEYLAKVATKMGHRPQAAQTLKEGRALLRRTSFDLVFLDVRLPDGNGLDLLKEIQGLESHPETIIITGEADPDGAEIAINNGAWDYLEKPLRLSDIRLPLIRAIQYCQEKKKSPLVALERSGIIGDSPLLKKCLDLVSRAANCDANTLISGETGTGKELFAEAIHQNSSRRQHDFIVVDCAAIPENLVESTLFGHVKGSFTGATKDADGLIKSADNSTLFLDEVGELPLSIQSSFLRVLQERRYRPVGAKHEMSSNFRLIAATNRDLEEMVAKGGFREDLYYRLQAITIKLPPLRERRSDINQLASHFVYAYCRENDMDTKGLSTEFLRMLDSDYDWRGNVRELANAISSSIAAASAAPVLYPEHLPTHLRAQFTRATISKSHTPSADSNPTGLSTLQEFREQAISRAENDYLLSLMGTTGWKIKVACEIAGISRPHLYSLLKKHGIARQKLS